MVAAVFHRRAVRRRRTFVSAAVRDEAVGVAVLDGVGEVAHDLAQRDDRCGGEVVRQSSGSKESMGGRAAIGGNRRWRCMLSAFNGAGLGTAAADRA